MQNKIFMFIMMYPVLLLSLSVHESAHAYMADMFGDPTAKNAGRVSLNPMDHIDILGTVIFPILALLSGIPLIGWAKPVPVARHNLRNPMKAEMYISAFGPLSNLFLALIFFVVFLFYGKLFAVGGGGLVYMILYFGVFINLLLAVFNMIPIPPLDGSGVIEGLLSPDLARKYEQLRPYGMIILYGLFFVGILDLIFYPIQIIMTYVQALV